MRLQYLTPAELSADQKNLYNDMAAGIARSYHGVQTKTPSGALVGPFNPWLHEPDFGDAIWRLNRALNKSPALPARVREVATLTVGAHYNAAYEVEAHRVLARGTGLNDTTVNALAAGREPSGLSADEDCAYRFALALCNGGVMPAEHYHRAADMLGARGVSELVYLCGFYALACMTMNAFDVAAPESA